MVLDIAIVNVALPSIGSDLDFAPKNLQWVITAYSLTYGGFLLLGGRAADLLGRRLVFMGGLALFAVASLVCGLSTSDEMLIIARGYPGPRRRALAPSALSIISTTFTEGSEREQGARRLGCGRRERRCRGGPVRRHPHEVPRLGIGSSGSTCPWASSC